MTRKSIRELERAVERLTDGDDVETDVVTEVVEIEDPDEEPAPTAPEGYELGPEIRVANPAVSVHAIAPCEGGDGGA